MHKRLGLVAAASCLIAGMVVAYLWHPPCRAPEYAGDPAYFNLPSSLFSDYPQDRMPQATLQSFLERPFTVFKDLTALPSPFSLGVSRSSNAIANPGCPFQESDAIGPGGALPFQRLIFGGVAGDEGFLYYEQGGLVRGEWVNLFTMSGETAPRVVWHGYCVAVDAKDFVDLRSHLLNGGCVQVCQRCQTESNERT
jgi:hypothetical protein